MVTGWVGVGLSAGAASPTAKQGPLRTDLGFPLGLLSVGLQPILIQHRARLHHRAFASSEGSRFASSVRRLPLENSTGLGAMAQPDS